MAKDVIAALSIDTALAAIVWATDPSFLKVVLGLGIGALVLFLALTKQERVSIYGANLVMMFVAVVRYLP